MAFLLRTVSIGADGRDIVRKAHVEGDSLVIGRSPDSDVHLTDLAVGLRHGRVLRQGGWLVVTAEPGLFVELNGRKSEDGRFELGSGGDLRIASHLLRFMPAAADAAEIEVAVERVTQGEVKRDRDADRLFSLTSVMPGKRPMAWLLLLLVLGIGLAWPIWTHYHREQTRARFAPFQGDELWSTGHLSQAHAALQKNCSACHVRPFEAVRDSACAGCHTGVHDHADPFRLARARPALTRWGAFRLSIKQALNLPPGRCVDCHGEHEGERPMTMTPQRFCADCHGGLHARLPDTKIADAGDFERAHPEFQPTFVTAWRGDHPRLSRLPISSRRVEASGLTFAHALHLAPRGGPAQMARRLGLGPGLDCVNCHRPDEPAVGFRPVEMERDCAMCHSLVFGREDGVVRTLRHGDAAAVVAQLSAFHDGRSAPLPPSLGPASRRLPGAAPQARERIQFERGARAPGAAATVRAAFSRDGACFGCHAVVSPGAGSLAFKVRPVAFPSRYLRNGWFDHRPHARQGCSDCHAAARSSAASDLLIPGLATCRTCHGGEQTAKPVASSCAMCHNYHPKEGAPTMIVRGLTAGRQRAAAPAPRGSPR